MVTRALRAAVVAEALAWEGTPFHDCCAVKGHGTDCVGLLIGVFSAVGLVKPFTPDAYKPQWFQHREEPRFLQGLEANGAHRIDPAAALPGDVLMYSFGRHAAHAAIVLDETALIHAYKPVGCVTRGDRREFAHRLDSAWSLFGAAP